MQSLGEEGQSAQTELQASPRPSLREINAIIKGLQLCALDRNDYRLLLDRRMPARTARFVQRLILRRRRRVILPHRFPAWWDVVIAEPETARDLLLLVLFTGMRPSQLTMLRWDQVDLAGRALYFPRSASGDWFGLPMSSFVAELIARRFQGSSDWVFPGRGRAGHIGHTQSIARRVALKAAVPFSFSDLRRTFIAVGVSLEVPADVIKALLGYQLGGDPLAVADQVEHLREPGQRIAERILSLAKVHERRGLLGTRMQPAQPMMMLSWG